eukprot:10722579-Karenia_brevis.AAC.1
MALTSLALLRLLRAVIRITPHHLISTVGIPLLPVPLCPPTSFISLCKKLGCGTHAWLGTSPLL